MPRLKDSLSTGLLVTVALSAVVSTGLAIRREIVAWKQTHNLGQRAPTWVQNWPALLSTGHRIGSLKAPVVVLEFVDYECPVCGDFTRGALRHSLSKYGDRVAVVVRNWPLPYHRLALPSARAVECASAQGKFREYHDLLFQLQDSLGLKSFESFARAAAVPDLLRFNDCVQRPGVPPTIQADMEVAKTLGSTGTPTVIVNGLMLPGAPDTTALDRYIESALAGRQR